MKFLVTGGLGFIGSAVVRFLTNNTDHEVYVVDKWGYASDIRNIGECVNVKFSLLDLTNSEEVVNLVTKLNPDYIMHLAAESHVDSSITGPREFINSNVIGTLNLLEAVRSLGVESNLKMFHHISTDEVYGDLDKDGVPFTEENAYTPSSPYAASKAASDHLVRAWGRTYGIPVVVTNCSNNFGPYHHPEKLIPRVITNILQGKPIPVYGDGRQVRDWLYVEDHAEALYKVVTEGEEGETYNIGSRNPVTNIDLIYLICEYMDTQYPQSLPTSSLIEFVTDRPGHDLRYEINPQHIETKLNWKPKSSFEEQLYSTIDWYVENTKWWEKKV